MGINSALGSSALLPAGLGFRNLIINGGMQVNQRNTAVTAQNDGYTVDRWFVGNSTGLASVSTAQNSDTPAGQGFTNSLRLTVTTGAALNGFGGPTYLRQSIEGYNSACLAYGSAGAKTVTLSFWVRSSVVGTYTAMLASWGRYLNYMAAYTVNAANTWEKKIITIPGETNGYGGYYWSYDSNPGVELYFVVSDDPYNAGSSGSWAVDGARTSVTGQVNGTLTTGNIFAITGVQLEQNYQPTPFEQRPIGVELALCQRYYINLVSGTGKALGTAYMSGTTTWEAAINFPQYMRTAPTLAYVTGAQYYGVYMLAVEQRVDSMTLDFATPSACRVYGSIVGASSTNGVAGILYTRNASAFLSVQAEL